MQTFPVEADILGFNLILFLLYLIYELFITVTGYPYTSLNFLKDLYSIYGNFRMDGPLFDLHTHTTFSDGTLSPADLVDMAVGKKLAAVAITDHDTVSGIRMATEYGRNKDIRVIPGVEISSVHDEKGVHILGYGLSPDASTAIEERLTPLQNGRTSRNRKIIEKLINLGIDINYDELVRFSGQGQIGRPHIATLLMKKGVVKSVQQAFDRLLKKGRPAFAPCRRYSAAEAIELIKKSGGLAVLAHPATIDPALASIRRLLEYLKGLGLDGIEVFYPRHARRQVAILQALTADFDLLATGGSDFHGEVKPDTCLGIISPHSPPPSDLLEKFLDRLP